MKKEQKTASGRELWKLLREAKSIRPQIALACLLSLILVGCVLVIPKLMGTLTQASRRRSSTISPSAAPPDTG